VSDDVAERSSRATAQALADPEPSGGGEDWTEGRIGVGTWQR
jgi:hypothetical protein